MSFLYSNEAGAVFFSGVWRKFEGGSDSGYGLVELRMLIITVMLHLEILSTVHICHVKG